MDDELKEQLSALIDDELRREESAFLLRRLDRSPDAVRQIGRYCLAREVFHRGVPTAPSWDLADRVSQALEDEAAHRRSAWLRARRALKPVAGVAVAASVASVSLLVWNGSEPGVPSAGQLAEQTAPLAATPVAATAATADITGRGWERLDPEVQQRLNSYLVNHSEHSSSGRIGSVFSYVRIAGHESDE